MTDYQDIRSPIELWTDREIVRLSLLVVPLISSADSIRFCQEKYDAISRYDRLMTTRIWCYSVGYDFKGKKLDAPVPFSDDLEKYLIGLGVTEMPDNGGHEGFFRNVYCTAMLDQLGGR